MNLVGKDGMFHFSKFFLFAVMYLIVLSGIYLYFLKSFKTLFVILFIFSLFYLVPLFDLFEECGNDEFFYIIKRLGIDCPKKMLRIN